MEGPSKTKEFEHDSFKSVINENIENVPYNGQSIHFHNDLDNYHKEDHCMKVNDIKDNLAENLEEPNKKSNNVYRVLEDSYIKYSDCGQPLKSQHIIIDFTPVPGVDDNEFLQQKCMDFWTFFNEHPKLQSIEIEKVHQSISNKIITDKISVERGSSQEYEIPAVKVLKRTDIQQKAFATKLKYTICEHLDNDYSLGETKVEQRQVKSKIPSNFSDSQHNIGLKPRSVVKNKSSIIKSRAHDEVKKLCHKMEEWDMSHPKTVEPPNRVPSISDSK